MSSRSTLVAVYRRTVRASIDRVWENVFDWEHLPSLHDGAFSFIELEDSGSWGWRARLGLQPAASGRANRIELVVEREANRYVTRTLDGRGAGTEIWTSLAPRGDATDIEVGFLVPDVTPERADTIGSAYTKLYAGLWDEDEGMMQERERQLALRVAPVSMEVREIDLGDRDQVRARTPFCVELGGRSFRIVEVAGELLAHSTVCPHWLGPLDDAPLEDGCVRCPWHGYLFDIRTGRSSDGHRLRLAPSPRVTPDGHRLRLVLPG